MKNLYFELSEGSLVIIIIIIAKMKMRTLFIVIVTIRNVSPSEVLPSNNAFEAVTLQKTIMR